MVHLLARRILLWIQASETGRRKNEAAELVSFSSWTEKAADLTRMIFLLHQVACRDGSWDIGKSTHSRTRWHINFEHVICPLTSLRACHAHTGFTVEIRFHPFVSSFINSGKVGIFLDVLF